MLRRNSTHHVFLYETEICARERNDYFSIASRYGFGTSAAYATESRLKDLVKLKLVKEVDEKYVITSKGRDVLAEMGNPLRVQARKTPLSKAAFEKAEANRAISSLPALSKDYLEYKTLSLRPGSLNFRSIPSIHEANHAS